MAFESVSLSFDYKNQATAESFNLINHDLLPNGIYEGFDLSKIDDTTVTVGTGTAYVRDSANSLSCRITLDAADNITVSTATPYIVMRFTWVNTETNKPSFLALGYSSIQATDIILGECIFDGSTLTEFSYTITTYASLAKLEENKNAFHVESSQPISNQIEITGGDAVINGKLVTITDTTFTVSTNTTLGRKDVIYVDDSGTVGIVEGIDAGSPTTPTYPANVLILCELQRGASRSTVKNNEIVQIANCNVVQNEVIPNVDNNFIGVIQSIQNGKVNASTNLPEFLSESSGVITLDCSSTIFRCNIGNGYSDFGKQAYRLNLTSDLTIDLSGASDDDYYIVLDYNPTTGVASLESNTVSRIMSTTPPSHATDQLWYDINNNKVYESDGSSAWTQVYKIVLGMVNKASSVYTIYNRPFNDVATNVVAVPSTTFSISSSTWGGHPMTVPLSVKNGDYNNEFDTSTYTFTAKRDMEIELFGIFSASSQQSYILYYFLNGTAIAIINETSALTFSGKKSVTLKTGDQIKLGAATFANVTGDESFCMSIRELSWRN